METSVDPAEWKLDGRLSSTGSWAEEVEAEDLRHRVGSSASLSSDQVTFNFQKEKWFEIDFNS